VVYVIFTFNDLIKNITVIHSFKHIEGIYRVEKSRKNLPKIPVYPISACDAMQFLG
jgi:hypothetical protein